MLSYAPILIQPESKGDFTLDSNASDEGIGAVFSQVQYGPEKVVAYGSKMLTYGSKILMKT